MTEEQPKFTKVDETIQQLEEKLRVEESRLRYLTQYFGTLVEAMVAAVVIADEELFVTNCNAAAASLFGRERDEIEGLPLSEVFPEDFKLLRDGLSLSDCEKFQQELFISSATPGRTTPVLVSASPIVFTTGEIEGVVCVAQDLTERRQLEEQLVHARKLESVGQLAAGVAHEINTPVQYIRDNMVFLKDEFPHIANFLQQTFALLEASQNSQWSNLKDLRKASDLDYLVSEIPSAVSQTLEGANSVAKIVNSMKEFSHPGSESKTAMNIHAALESTLTVSRNEWKYLAEIELEFHSADPELVCFGSDLNQAFLNIIVNSAHAIGERVTRGDYQRGAIRIETRDDDDALVVTVKDNGIGMSEEIVDRIFDPFFTTKEVGKGTGQGLTLVHQCIRERHQGSIHVKSVLGEGTVIELSLPRHESGK
ncbi:MAG: PAS domain-containing protein [Bdellovibrionales bacterium]|nr:PAS domain-containing protein [Bdellovibrionales bacterium]